MSTLALLREQIAANRRAYQVTVAIVVVGLALFGLLVTLALGLGVSGLGAGLGLAVLVVWFAPGVGERAALRSSELVRHAASAIAVAIHGLRSSALHVERTREAVTAFRTTLEGERDKLRLGQGSIEDILFVEDRLTDALLEEVVRVARRQDWR